jgi:hypothetical protein
MSKSKPPQNPPPPRLQEHAQREAALRDNLMKRKQQSRARTDQDKEKEKE